MPDGQRAVKLDVFAAADIAGLDEFLGYDGLPFGSQPVGVPGCAVAFTGVGVDAGDEYFAHFCRMMKIG